MPHRIATPWSAWTAAHAAPISEPSALINGAGPLEHDDGVAVQPGGRRHLEPDEPSADHHDACGATT